MNNRVNSIQINLYSISSDFRDIMLRLCEKLIQKSQKTIILLNDSNELDDLDNFLWIKNKNNFIPHKIVTDEISSRDNLLLADCNLKKLNIDKKFDTLIISPRRSIKAFKYFRKFLVFSNKKRDFEPNLYKNKLELKGYNVVCYEEYQKFKWKVS